MHEKPIDLRNFRKSNNLSQDEVANFLEVTRGFISLIETERTNLPEDKLNRLKEEGPKMGWDVAPLFPYATRIRKLESALEAKSNAGETDFPFSTKDKFGLDDATYDKIMSGKTAINAILAGMIHLYNGDINPDWLVSGQGDMFIRKAKVHDSDTTNDVLKELHHLSDRIVSLEQKIETLIVLLGGKLNKT